MTEQDLTPGVTRRVALQRAGLVTGGAVAVWAAPSITTLGGLAFAGSAAPAPGETTTNYDPTAELVAFAGSASGGNNAIGSTSFGHFSAETLSGPEFAYFENPNSQISGAAFKVNAGSLADGDYRLVGLAGGSSLLIHPGNGVPVAVRFHVPATGSLALAASFTDSDPGGGDGVTVGYAVNGSTVTQTPIDAPGSPTTSFSATINVSSGDTIDLFVSPNSNNSNDSTTLTASFALTA